MTELEEACSDLAQWLPVAAALITQPDTQPSIGHARPDSKPPWNTAVANAYYDAHAAVRDLEQELRQAVTGSPAHLTRRRTGWSHTATLSALDAVSKLSAAVDDGQAGDVLERLSRMVTVIMALPAIDVAEERWRKLPGPCPRCSRRMLMACVVTGKVGCLGCRCRGVMRPGTVSDGFVEWQDGEIT